MKLIAINKVLNEERFIANYCRNHSFCDRVLVADGGSIDDTVKIAGTFDNVRVTGFDEKIDLPDGSFMNPEPAHTNFLLDWADEEKADWVLFTGCDTWPGKKLQKNARQIFTRLESGQFFQGILAYQIYLWEADQYFPKINSAGQALWSWRTSLGIRCDETGDSFFDTVMPGPPLEKCFKLDGSYILLHYFSDPEREEMKLKRYEAWGHPKTHILESIYAPPEPLPDWIKEQIP